MKIFNLLFLFSLGIVSTSSAQNPNLFYNKGADITVQAGATVTIQGELVNTDNTLANVGKIHNLGDIYVKENWTNNSSSSALDPNDGTVHLNGSATIPFPVHIIGGSTPTTFNNLFLQGKAVELQVNTTVAGTTGTLDLGSVTMDLKSKILTVTNTVPAGPSAAIVFAGGGSIISETDFTAGYGIVKWNIIAATSGTQFIVPFGRKDMQPVQVTFEPSANITDPAGNVSFSTYPTLTTPANNNRPFPNGVNDLNSPCTKEWATRTVDRFYVVNPQGYSTTPPAQLTLQYVDDEQDASAGSTNIIIPAKLKVARYDSKWNVLGGTSSVATKDVTQGNINKYGVFALMNFDPLKTTYKDSADVTCFGGNDGEIDVTVTSGNKPYTFTLLPLPNIAQADSMFKTLIAGTYHVIVIDAAGCDSTLRNIVIKEPTKLKVDSITGTKLTCPLSADGVVTFLATGGTPNANSPLYTFTATPNAGVTVSTNNANSTLTGLPKGTTMVEVTDANNCKSTTTIFLVPPPPFTATLSPDAAVCEGSAGKVWVNISAPPLNGKGPYTYTWVDVPSLAPVAQHPSNFDNDTLTQTPTQTQQYGVAITDACNTIVPLQAVSIVVNPLPTPDFDANIKNGCENLNVVFADLTPQPAAPSTITGWLWNFGDGDYSYNQNPSHFYTNKGSYDVTLTATTTEGCSATIPYTGFININPNPKAAFTPTPETTTILDPKILFANNSSADVIKLVWNFGDGNQAAVNVKNPLHTYGDTGTYNVELKVTNQFNCSDSVSLPVKIIPNLTFFIPNSFTPNSDNINENFYPKGSYFRNYNMKIYDRWGEKVFVSGTANEGWDGTLVNGGVAPVGVYVYKIKVEDTLGKDYYYSGTVSLIR